MFPEIAQARELGFLVTTDLGRNGPFLMWSADCIAGRRPILAILRDGKRGTVYWSSQSFALVRATEADRLDLEKAVLDLGLAVAKEHDTWGNAVPCELGYVARLPMAAALDLAHAIVDLAAANDAIPPVLAA